MRITKPPRIFDPVAASLGLPGCGPIRLRADTGPPSTPSISSRRDHGFHSRCCQELENKKSKFFSSLASNAVIFPNFRICKMFVSHQSSVSSHDMQNYFLGEESSDEEVQARRRMEDTINAACRKSIFSSLIFLYSYISSSGPYSPLRMGEMELMRASGDRWRNKKPNAQDIADRRAEQEEDVSGLVTQFQFGF